jgi:hypothetical protein
MPALSAIAQAALDRALGTAMAAPAGKKRRHWTPEEVEQLRQLYPDTPMALLMAHFNQTDRAIYAKAHALGLARSEAYLASEHGGRMRRGASMGAAGRFPKGNVPWNAGLNGWTAGGRSAETRFKPGAKPHTWVPIGTEQLREGYLWRKVTDNGGRHDWRQVHVMLWEQHNGPIAKGLILVFRDRNKQNIQIDNLELITRAENCRRNSIHRYPPELKQAIRQLARVKRRIEEKRNEESA